MSMWHDHLQLDLWPKCIVRYDKEIRCAHMWLKVVHWTWIKKCPLDDVYVTKNNDLKFIIESWQLLNLD